MAPVLYNVFDHEEPKVKKPRSAAQLAAFEKARTKLASNRSTSVKPVKEKKTPKVAKDTKDVVKSKKRKAVEEVVAVEESKTSEVEVKIIPEEVKIPEIKITPPTPPIIQSTVEPPPQNQPPEWFKTFVREARQRKLKKPPNINEDVFKVKEIVTLEPITVEKTEETVSLPSVNPKPVVVKVDVPKLKIFPGRSL